MTKAAQVFDLLRKFYPSEGLYLKEFNNFSTSSASVAGTFNVPMDAAYSIVDLNYVTAEQYVRCFSQLAYGLAYLLAIYHDGMRIYGTPEDFKQRMFAGQLWYRRMSNVHFVKKTLKGHDFDLSMEVTRVEKKGN